MISPLDAVLLAASAIPLLFWAACVGYLLVLSMAAALARRTSPPPAAGEPRRYCILIPAHNEELNLGAVVDGLNTLEHPREKWTAVVIADNCSDATAAVAREHGAEVLERTNPDLRGKGYALEWAIGKLLPDPRGFDAFIIMDADSSLSPNFLAVMDGAMARGAEVVQGYYGVLNVAESWRTKLMAVALALAHHVKPQGRRKLGLSDGLKGNGMCFSRAVLERVPWSGESITEDIEYTLRLVDAGIRIEFAPEAVVTAQMPVDGKQAATQRQRWEGGRYGLLKRAIRLLWSALRGRRWMQADRAVELIIPPFAEMFAVPVIALALTAVWRAYSSSPAAGWMLWAWSAVLAAEVAYLAAGLWIARVPWSVAKSLLFAPLYIVWKLTLYGAMALRRGAGGWQRTERRSL
jgi:cellulose synthase/poly-beta-1,6-N-acetylglucosamine synthase-like glycosyltransferase